MDFDVDLAVKGQAIEAAIEKQARQQSWKDANKDEVTVLLEQALEEAKTGYDLDAIADTLSSVGFLIADDAGEYEGLATPFAA